VPAQVLYRAPLVALAVLACYLFDWDSLRYITSEICLRLAHARGVEGWRLGRDLIVIDGAAYQYTIACTFADVFCGAIPLLWIRPAGVARNLRNLGAFAAILFFLNIVRLCITDMMVEHDVPWTIADECLGGLAYFTVWCWIVYWLESQDPVNRPRIPGGSTT
jgi:hypothetical protein